MCCCIALGHVVGMRAGAWVVGLFDEPMYCAGRVMTNFVSEPS